MSGSELARIPFAGIFRLIGFKISKRSFHSDTRLRLFSYFFWLRASGSAMIRTITCIVPVLYYRYSVVAYKQQKKNNKD